MKILSITERAGGLTMNDARALTRSTLGLEAEEYPNEFNMDDIGTVPLSVINTITAMKEYGCGTNGDASDIDDIELEQLNKQIQKAMDNKDEEVAAVMKEVKKLILKMDGGTNESY